MLNLPDTFKIGPVGTKPLYFQVSEPVDQKLDREIAICTQTKFRVDLEESRAEVYLDLKLESTSQQSIQSEVGVESSGSKAASNVLLHSVTLTLIKIENVSQHLDEAGELTMQIKPLLLGVALGTLRGRLNVLTQGFSINQFELPVLNPNDMLKQEATQPS